MDQDKYFTTGAQIIDHLRDGGLIKDILWEDGEMIYMGEENRIYFKHNNREITMDVYFNIVVYPSYFEVV